MYCEKCNKYYSKDDKYCNICGNELIEKEKPKEKGKKKKSKKNTTLIIILIILGVSLFIGSTVFAFTSVFKYVDKLSVLDYVELGDDEIPTMHLVNNSITADWYSKNIENDYMKVEMEYNKNLYNYDIIDEYISFMEDNGFTYVEISSTNWYLVSESVDDNKILLVNIYEDTADDGNLYFTVTYEKKNGKIDDYVEKVNYMEVGKEKYGYISLPDTWQLDEEKTENLNIMKYYKDDNSLLMYYVENSSVSAEESAYRIYDYYKEDGDKDMKIIIVKVDNYDAYQISGYIEEEGIYYVAWIFTDENNTLHHIEFCLDKKDNNIFKLIETFKLEK